MKTNAQPKGAASAEKKNEAKSTSLVIVDAPAQSAPTEQTPKRPTVEEVREKSIRLNDLFEKEEKLLSTKSSLQTFRVASDEFTNKLEISDGKGATFKTYNPRVIGSIIEILKRDIEATLEETQVEIIALA